VGDSDEANSTAQLIVEDLKAVGVKVAVKAYPQAELNTRTYVRGGAWDMVMRSLGGANLPRLFRIQHSDPRIVIMGDGLAQPEIDRQIEEAETKPDQESRNKAWQSLQKVFLERATPLMPLFSRRVFIGYHSYVKGYDTSPRAGAKWTAPIPSPGKGAHCGLG
jgi:ABC-type transport system substrate-binding protein